jgi:phytoene synthase
VSSAAQQICKDSIRQNSRSFYLASQLLPKRDRGHATVVYAWCRRADDTVDEGYGNKHVELAELRSELDTLEAGRTTGDPIVDAFGEVARACGIPFLYPRELLRGMETDIGSVCYQTMDELLEYCYRVASTVGLMMCHVMGVDDDNAIAHAAHLGVAMQLTNISRDVMEDWKRGRLYLPDELLAKHGAAGLGDSLGGEMPRDSLAPLASAVEELLALADRYYRSGDEGLSRLPWRCSVAIEAARRIYAEIGSVLVERNFDVSAGRAIVSPRRKLELVGHCLLNQAKNLPARSRGGHFEAPSRLLSFAQMPRL